MSGEEWCPVPVDDGYPPTITDEPEYVRKPVYMSEADCLPEWANTGQPADAEKALG